MSSKLIKDLIKSPKLNHIELYKNYRKECKDLYKNPITIIDPDILVGIEIEFQNYQGLDKPIYLWNISEDGSLRNNGVEFISIPLKNEYIGEALYEFIACTSKEIQFSERTSIHIHINALDLTSEDIYKIFLTYLVVEPVLYNWIGHNREHNIFCVPWYTTQDIFFISNRIKKLDLIFGSGHSIQSSEKRYTGLNLDSLSKFGTLEFRQMYGTRDINKIVDWINILLVLRRSKDINLVDLTNKIIHLNTYSNYLDFLEFIFGPIYNLLYSFNVDKLLEQGSKMAKQSLLDYSILETFVHNYSHDSDLSKILQKLGYVNNLPLTLDPGFRFVRPMVVDEVEEPMQGVSRASYSTVHISTLNTPTSFFNTEDN